MELIDCHAHLTDEKFFDLEDVIERAKEKNVKKIICSAYDLSSSQGTIKIADEHENVFATVGVHPENIDGLSFDVLNEIKKLAKNKKVVAIGEIGLDYHFKSDNSDLQKEFFERQIDLANALSLPIVIHSRDAMGDTIKILENKKLERESLLHCYSGSVESANILMKLGFSFSFGGVTTFSNAKNVIEVVKSLPIEKILLETDCPYLSPIPFRGQRNEPKNIVYIADTIAKIKGMSLEELAEKTTQNAKRMFLI